MYYVVGYEEGDLFQAICSLGAFPSEAYVPSWRSITPSDSKSANNSPTADEIQKEVTNVTTIIGKLFLLLKYTIGYAMYILLIHIAFIKIS